MPTKKQVVGEFRCRAICEAAMRVVGRKGLAKATVQEIAREAGVAKGTVYLYFPSRDAILERTVEAAVGQLLERLGCAGEAGRTTAKSLELILAAQFAFFDENRDFFRLYFASGETSEDRRLRQSRNYRDHIEHLAGIIRAGRRRGEVKSADPERAAIAIAGAARDLILRRINETKPPSPAADARLLTELVFHGLEARESENKSGPRSGREGAR